MPPEGFQVEIEVRGRGGDIIYREGENSYAFEWDFGAARTVVLIYAPSPARWDAELPWAAGRRAKVLERVGREVVRQKAPSCSHAVHAGGVDILEPA